MNPKVYISGKLYDKADAKISVFDHGLLYGDGVFEGIRAYSGRVFRLKQHVDRLYDSAQAIHLQIPMSREEMADGHRRHARRQQADRRLHPRRRHPGRRQPGPRPAQDDRPAGHHHHRPDQPLSRRAVRARPEDHHGGDDAQPSQRRQPADQVAQLPEQHPGQDRGDASRLPRSPDAQPQGRGRRVHRRQHLRRPARARSTRPRSTRASSKGSPATPSSSWPARPGITVIERTMDRHDVFTADECFLTGTAAEVIPVVECDGRVIGTGQARPDHPRASRAVPRPGPRRAMNESDAT